MFTLQILHASDLEGGVDAIQDAPNFAAIVDALEADAENQGIASILLSSGDNYIPGPLFNAGGDFSLGGTYEGFYNELFGLINVAAISAVATDANGDGFFDNGEIETAIDAGLIDFDTAYTTDVNGDGFKDYFEEIDGGQGGRLDAAIVNALDFDASAVGNHEFDQGTDAFENIINYDSEEGNSVSTSRYADSIPGHINFLQEVDTPGVQFPYLSANLDFSQDFDVGALFTDEILLNTEFESDLLSAREPLPGSEGDFPEVFETAGDPSDSNDPKIAPATIIEEGGERIGVVGATTQLVSTISSTGNIEDKTSPGVNDMAALAALLQPVIDQLTLPVDQGGEGINKVILVSHLQQFSLEQELATLLSGVDVILAGGSDTISADDQDRLRSGDTADQPYPFEATDADGNPTLIVSTDGEYSYVGRLVVTFDDDGIVIPGSVDESVSGAFATDEQGVLDVTGEATLEDAIANSEKATQVDKLTDAVLDIVNELDGDIAGETDVFLNGERADVRTQETNLGNLTADANLIAVNKLGFNAQVSLKNGGGIRAPIGDIDGDTGDREPPAGNPLTGKEEGQISELDIDNVLRFDNELTVLDLSLADLKIILEHSVAGTAEGNTPGQFPQVGGLHFSFDPSGTAQVLGANGVPTTEGTRVQNVTLVDENGVPTQALIRDGEIVDSAPQIIRVVTLDFLVGGGDGYPFEDLGENIVESGIGEQQALSDFLTENHPDEASSFNIADTDVGRDARIQILDQRTDTVDAPIATQDIDGVIVNEFDSGLGAGGSEVVAHEDGILYVTNGEADRIDIFDIEGDSVAGSIPLDVLDGFDGVQSVAVSNGVVAVAISRANEEATRFGQTIEVAQPGFVALFDAETLALIDTVETGVLPDQLTFTPDGSKLLVAGEGEFNQDSIDDGVTVNPLGTVTVIDVSDLGNITSEILDFTDFNGFEDGARDNAGIRIQLGESFAADVEPEYIAISPDGMTAFVALQENNAIATIDLSSNSIIDVFGLGTVDFSQTPIDANDNGIIEIQTFDNLVGFRMPDAIAAFEAGGENFVITANEGDSRDFDEDRVADLVEDGLLDDALVTDLLDKGLIDEDPDTDVGIERLEVSTIDGDTDGDGDIDVIHAFNSRSFSIFNEDGDLVFDSGSDFEKIIAELAPERFNDDDGDDGEDRSDAKGPEPEAIITGQVGDRLYAFIGLERDSGIMIYDITVPEESFFVNYLEPRFEAGDGEIARQSPEVITFIPAEDSTTGKAQIAVAYEISGTTIVYDLEERQAPVINEVVMSTSGLDVEFIELFGEPGESLNGLSLVSFNGNTSEAGDINLRIDFTPDQKFGDNGFFLVGNAGLLFSNFGVLPNISIGDNAFENDSQFFVLVETNSLVTENGGDTIVNDPETVVVDSVAFVNGDLDIVDFFGAPVVGPDGNFLPAGGFRLEDGVDTDQAEDFGLADFNIDGNTPTAGTGIPTDIEAVTIPEIQGAGHVSAFEGQSVITTGIVTAVAFNGFFMQDPEGDEDDTTSDGIFVFTGGSPSVAVGDEAQVVATVAEFIPGGADTGNLSITQLTGASVTVLSEGNDLPEAILLGANGRQQSDSVVISDDELPVNLQEEPGTFNPETDAIDFFEALEGMLVEIDNPVAVSATRTFSSFSSEAFVVADNGEFASGRGGGLNDRGGIDINADADGTGDLNPERIQIQFDPDVSGGADVPGLNVGDQLENVTGVVSYNFGNFEVVATEQVVVETPSTLEEEVTELVGNDDQLTVATYNVLNLTSSAADGDPDGAQRDKLADQIVNNLGSPDIIALQEIQDNDGSGGDNELVTDATQTLQDLVDAIAAAGGPNYVFVDVFDGADASEFTSVQGGVPGGNIRNGFLFNADRVELNELTALTPTQLEAFGVDNPDAFEGSRVPLLGTFEFNGEEVTVINNHFSSRFGSTPIFGGEQPFVQAGEDEREQQALANNQVVDALLADNPDANVIVTGDLNTFEFTDELSEDLPGVGDDKVLTNLIGLTEGDDAYSFIFDGNSQALDHVFVTDGLLETAEVDYVHLNVDFNRDDDQDIFEGAVTGSDHEPIVARFTIETPGLVLTGTERSDALIGEDGDDMIIGLGGRDVIRGGEGDDSLFGVGGADNIQGGLGVDVILGGDGQDSISGGEGTDSIFGENGRDVLEGDEGEDLIFGGNGADFISGGSENDDLFGDNGGDNINGDEGDDMIFGGGGGDDLDGGEGADSLSGEGGQDFLNGGSNDMANDELSGGGGADTFFFEGDFGDDVITDFNANRDDLVILGDATSEVVGDDTVITVTGASEGTITLLDVDNFDVNALV